jgi:hypothetical protein
MYAVEIESQDGQRLVYGMTTFGWEPVYRWVTWTTDATVQDAHRTIVGLCAGQSRHVRRMRITHVQNGVRTTVAEYAPQL